MKTKEFTSFTEAHAFMQFVEMTGNTKFYIGNDLKNKIFTVYWS